MTSSPFGESSIRLIWKEVRTGWIAWVSLLITPFIPPLADKLLPKDYQGLPMSLVTFGIVSIIILYGISKGAEDGSDRDHTRSHLPASPYSIFVASFLLPFVVVIAIATWLWFMGQILPGKSLRGEDSLIIVAPMSLCFATTYLLATIFSKPVAAIAGGPLFIWTFMFWLDDARHHHFRTSMTDTTIIFAAVIIGAFLSVTLTKKLSKKARSTIALGATAIILLVGPFRPSLAGITCPKYVDFVSLFSGYEKEFRYPAVSSENGNMTVHGEPFRIQHKAPDQTYSYLVYTDLSRCLDSGQYIRTLKVPVLTRPMAVTNDGRVVSAKVLPHDRVQFSIWHPDTNKVEMAGLVQMYRARRTLGDLCRTTISPDQRFALIGTMGSIGNDWDYWVIDLTQKTTQLIGVSLTGIGNPVNPSWNGHRAVFPTVNNKPIQFDLDSMKSSSVEHPKDLVKVLE